MKTLIATAIAALIVLPYSLAGVPQERQRLDDIEKALKDDAPGILCIDANFATAGQPSFEAFRKFADNGYRSVLNLRTASEGIDLDAERAAVEKAGMRYIGIPVSSSDLKPVLADQFLEAVRDKANRPMLIHCASANRVGAFWMIYRMLDQGWPEEKALEEAKRIGLRSPVLTEFAQQYVANRKKKPN